MLKSVTVRRFKNINEATISLSRVNVLVGTNNSGKSSVLQALAFAVSAAQSALLHKGANRKGSVTLAPEQLIYAPLRDVMALAMGGSLRQVKEHAIEVEFASTPPPAVVIPPLPVLPVPVVPMGEGGEGAPRPALPLPPPPPPGSPSTMVRVRRGKNSNLLIDTVRTNRDNIDIAGLSPPFCIYVPGLAGIPAVEPYRTPAALRKAAARGDSNSVLRNVLLALHKDGGAWARFAENLDELFPGHSIAMRFEPERDEAIGAFLITNQGELPLDAAGTGLLQAIQILAYAARETPPLLLLDEPDSHLHPDKQRALMGLLQKLAEQGDFQVIIATHSRHMIDALDDDAGLHWMSGGAVRPAAETDLVSVLTELGALDRGDLLRNGAIDAVVLTEDRNPRAIAPLLIAAGFDPDRVQVWSYNTCTQIQRARLLADFISQHAPATQVIVHVDRDYQSDEAVLAKKEQFRAERLTLFVTDGVDAESQYLTAEHVNHLMPGVALAEAQQLIDQSRSEVRAESLRRLARELTIRDNASHAGDPHHVADAMAISGEANRLLDANPVRWSYGKKALGILTALLQVGRGPVRLLQASPYVCHPDLVDVHARIHARE